MEAERRFSKRLTVNAGVRADVYTGVFGNTDEGCPNHAHRAWGGTF